MKAIGLIRLKSNPFQTFAFKGQPAPLRCGKNGTEKKGKEKLINEPRAPPDGPVLPESARKLVAAVCPELVPDESFCIVSEPGSSDQPEHTDSVPNDAELTPAEWQLSRTYLGILTPLVKTSKRCGQTGVRPRSHLAPPPFCDAEERLSMQPGDMLLLDGRTVHRGLANRADPDAPPRRMGFFTFKRPGLTDGNSVAYEENHSRGEVPGEQAKRRAMAAAAAGDGQDDDTNAAADEAVMRVGRRKKKRRMENKGGDGVIIVGRRKEDRSERMREERVGRRLIAEEMKRKNR